MNRWTDEPVMDQLRILEEGGGGNTQWLHVFETGIMLGHAGHFISRSEVIFPVAPRSSRLVGMGWIVQISMSLDNWIFVYYWVINKENK